MQSIHSLRYLLSTCAVTVSGLNPLLQQPPSGRPGPCLLEASRPQLFELAHQRRIDPDPPSGAFFHGSAQLLPASPKGVLVGAGGGGGNVVGGGIFISQALLGLCRGCSLCQDTLSSVLRKATQGGLFQILSLESLL